MDPEKLRIIKLHKSWADRLILLWHVLALTLLGGFYFIFEYIGVSATERTGLLLVLSVMILIAALWQAIGLGIARVHMIISGIDLEGRG